MRYAPPPSSAHSWRNCGTPWMRPAPLALPAEPARGIRMNWFKKLVPSRINTEGRTARRSVPEGLWTKCDECNSVLYRAEVERNLFVCPKCGHHMRLTARQRLDSFLDAGSGIEIGENVEPVDMLRFRDSKKYKDRITSSQKATGEKDALVAMRGRLKGMRIVACAFEFNFMG